MKISRFHTIRTNLFLLVLIAVLPGQAILLFSDLKEQEASIKNAEREVVLLTQAMANVQRSITETTKQILSTLALTPAIRNLDIKTTTSIFQDILDQNPEYNNILLLDPEGNVLTSGRAFAVTNLLDRIHIRETHDFKRFSVGEFIISRGEDRRPIFPFSYPVLGNDGTLKAILTTSVKLANLSHFHDFSSLPGKSFVAITDHKGIRLFYYPAQEKTNPIGKPIKPAAWDVASKSQGSGTYKGAGSDGLKRIISFSPARLRPDSPPYLYVWAGIPETTLLAASNAELRKNLLFLLLATAVAFLLAHRIGKKTILTPVQDLVELAKNYGKGQFDARSAMQKQYGEFGALTKAFHQMADSIQKNQKVLLENEERFRNLLNSLDALVYVADMETYEILFINDYGKKLLGDDPTGKLCWQNLQKDQQGPCAFCTNKYLLNEEGHPREVYREEQKNTLLGQWFQVRDRAIVWPDGRIVRMEIATDITERKENELIKDALIEKLEHALSEIKTLRGIMPICSFCKKIRDDEGYWDQVEVYVKKHSDADFSHSICPDCAKKHYPQFIDKTKKK